MRLARRYLLLPLGLAALIVGQAVALSAEHIITSGLVGAHSGASVSLGLWVEIGTLFAALLVGVVCWLLFGQVQDWLDSSLRQGQVPWRRRIDDAAQVVMRPGNRHRAGLALLGLLALGIGCSAHWIANVAWHLVSGRTVAIGPTGSDWQTALGGTVIFVGLALSLRLFERLELRIPAGDEPGAYSALLLFLSNPLNARIPQGAGGSSGPWPYTWAEFARDLESLQLDSADRERAIAAMGRNAWLMPILSVFHQVRMAERADQTLDHVVLIVSKEPEPNPAEWRQNSGTVHMAELFTRVLRKWLGDLAPRFHVYPEGGANFEDPKELHEAIEGSYELLYRQKLTGQQGILLDLTGGTKHCSLLAGIMSFEPGRVFSYMSGNGYKPLQYDFRRQEAPRDRIHGG